MAVLLALAAAVAWGSSDFAAGLASRRASAVSVVVLTHFASALALLAVSVDPFALVPDGLSAALRGSPKLVDLAWGLAAGAGGGFGAFFLFRGLGRGAMAVVAPITAAGAATIPVVVGVALGDPLGPLTVVGMALALAAIILISLGAPDLEDDPAAAGVAPPAAGAPATSVVDRARRSVLATPGVTDALLSGWGFGSFYVCISRAADDAGFWPLLSGRGLSYTVFGVLALATAVPVVPAAGSRRPVVLAGVLDAVAAGCFVLAARVGLLSIGAVLASLYPAATVVLARVVLAERIHRRQLSGLGLAAVAVALLAL